MIQHSYSHVEKGHRRKKKGADATDTTNVKTVKTTKINGNEKEIAVNVNKHPLEISEESYQQFLEELERRKGNGRRKKKGKNNKREKREGR